MHPSNGVARHRRARCSFDRPRIDPSMQVNRRRRDDDGSEAIKRPKRELRFAALLQLKHAGSGGLFDRDRSSSPLTGIVHGPTRPEFDRRSTRTTKSTLFSKRGEILPDILASTESAARRVLVRATLASCDPTMKRTPRARSGAATNVYTHARP